VGQWKIGADLAGLLRPDKIVAYFPDFDALARAAQILCERLDGLPAHGVPFTAEIGGGGLLSWGMDPPRDEALPWSGPESWRIWLANRLARALLDARAQTGTVETDPAPLNPPLAPWRFAVERLRLEGVDTDSWTPGALVFKEV